jgi:hypothetical protein
MGAILRYGIVSRETTDKNLAEGSHFTALLQLLQRSD